MLKLNSIKAVAIPDDGDWVESTDWPGVRLRVRSINVRDYQVAHGLLQQKLIKALGRSPVGPEWEPALSKIVARHLLRGWEGIAGDDDKPLVYTPEIGLETLSNPDFASLEREVIWAASRVGERDAEFTVDAAKNSSAPSATN
jgi:hypothetical protein